MPKKNPSVPKSVEALLHVEDKRKNIPTAEHRSVMDQEKVQKVLRYPRNTDLDPQLVWKGKDEQDWSDLVVTAPPLYIQEKVHPKVIIDDLLRISKESEFESGHSTLDLFSDFNGIPKGVDKTEFYQHEQNWTNRMILGDSLQVMASLAEREGLRGKVQCVYFDPPYGIRFNSNFQWSTTSRDVKDGKADHITREPEQVKAFRDTWRDGIHSYLTYLRDRLTVARDLLADSGSIFLQIGDENVHRVRAVLDEVFGPENLIASITCKKTTGNTANYLPTGADFVLWYARDAKKTKYRDLLTLKEIGGEGGTGYTKIELPSGIRRGITSQEMKDPASLPDGSKVFSASILVSQSVGREKGEGAASWFPVRYLGMDFRPSTKVRWKTNELGMARLTKVDRLYASSGDQLSYVRYFQDFPAQQLSNVWTDTVGQNQFGGEKLYVVQTALRIVERCILMSTDPGDLVIDPTCGSGTSAVVAEQWGRRWITIDTSRVALALARARVMGARFPYYLLADSPEGQKKTAEMQGRAPVFKPTYSNIHHGFVYDRVPHVTLKSIVSNSEIDVIWDKWEPKIELALNDLNRALKGQKIEFKIPVGGRAQKKIDFSQSDKDKIELPTGEKTPANALLEWEVPKVLPESWQKFCKEAFDRFWEVRLGRQAEMNGSIAAKAEFEALYDKPFEEKKKARVAGPFTVESLSPHRVLGVDENDEVIDPLVVAEGSPTFGTLPKFENMVLENLKSAGVQQAHKQDRIGFESIVGWPGSYICAEACYLEAGKLRRAGIFVGPEFGTVSRPDLVEAAREAGDAGFDVVISCAFNYEAHAGEFTKLGRIPVLKARMNADLHMAEDLKATGKGNLFVVFGEPDIDLLKADGERLQVKVNGVDVFDPSTGEIRSDGADGIACWFIDTDYNGESFFVRHAYFLGQNDPYNSLKTTLKAEINEEAWESLNKDISRPFEKPKSGRIAVKVINHLGDEVMRVFKV